MTNDKIAEIRARHEELDAWLKETRGVGPAAAHTDRATLLAEVEKLRIAMAPGLHANAWAQSATARAARAKAAAEKQAEKAAHLEAEVERLRAALLDIALGDYSDPMRAREALAGNEGGR